MDQRNHFFAKHTVILLFDESQLEEKYNAVAFACFRTPPMSADCLSLKV